MAIETDYALIVGINEYEELPRLNGPIADAMAFRDWVTSAEGGDIPDGNCKFVDNTDSTVPTQDLIDRKLPIHEIPPHIASIAEVRSSHEPNKNNRDRGKKKVWNKGPRNKPTS